MTARAVLLLALVLAPGAAAAAPVTITVGDVGPIIPNEGLAVTAATVHVDCDLLPENTTTPPRPVSLLVVERPPWATVTVSPSTQLAHRDDCVDGRWTGTSDLIISTTPDSLAFTPTPYTVGVIVQPMNVENLTGEWAANATGSIVAGPVSIIDAVAESTVATVGPGETAVFRVTVHNFGNLPTNVFFDIEDVPDGWGVGRPPPVALEARASRPEGSATEVTFAVTAPAGDAFAHESRSFVLHAKARDVGYDNVTYVGDETQASFHVTVRGVAVPGVGVAAACLAAALALVGRKTR